MSPSLLKKWICPCRIITITEGHIFLSGQLFNSKNIRLSRVLLATGKVETLREGNGLQYPGFVADDSSILRKDDNKVQAS
jgi:hypothetical protein